MIRNYLKIAWRNLWKNKFYSAINILGLAIGLSVSILLMYWVQDEWGFDRFHRDVERIYKINAHVNTGDGSNVWGEVPAPVSTLAKKIPEVNAGIRMQSIGTPHIKYQQHVFDRAATAFVDSNFFTFFDFKLLQGNPKQPFPNINAVVLSSSLAKILFGETDPIGKTITIMQEFDFSVAGVMADFPENSSFKYQLLVPMSWYAKQFTEWGGNGSWKTIEEDVGNYSYTTFLKLSPGTNLPSLSEKLTVAFNKKRESPITPDRMGTRFELQALKDMHLVSKEGNSQAKKMVQIFFIIGVFILLIACINYVNLSTARAMLRFKEVSMRKIVGANKKQLFFQFIIETACLLVLGFLLAIAIITLVLPLYNSTSGKHLNIHFTDIAFWKITAYCLIGTLFASSIYPAFLLSSFNPLETLRGNLMNSISSTTFRRVLVIFQFSIACVLIFGTLVINKQLHYIRNMQIGYDRSYVLTSNIPDIMRPHLDVIKNTLEEAPAVQSVSFTNANILGGFGETADIEWEGKDDRNFLIKAMRIDQHFIPTLKLSLADGQNFQGTVADSAHFILNETAIAQMGIQDPVGKRIKLWQQEGTIIGVVKDFNYASLKEKIAPLVFFYKQMSESTQIVYAKTTAKDAPAVIASMQELWKQFAPDYTFDYRFMDQDFEAHYRAEQRSGKLLNIFSSIAIILSCMGLLGLATYIAQLKVKEIGIRKVLGASVSGILYLISADFIRLVFIAILIASPLAWWFMHQWLQDFAYHMNLSWWLLVISGGLAILIAILTISFQIIKAAMANPVQSLRNE